MIQRVKQRVARVLHLGDHYTKTDTAYLFHTGFWTNLNSLILALFSLGLYVAYAHFLSKETYGTYQYLLSWFSIATAFTLTGMNSAVIRAVAQGYEGTFKASLPIQIRYGSIPFLGGVGIALYYLYAGNMLLAGSLVIIGILTPLLYAFNTYGSFLIGKKEFRASAFYGITTHIVYYALLVAVAFFSGSPILLLTANLGIQVLLYAFLCYHIMRRYTPNDRIDQEALSYGMHLSAMNVFGSVTGQLGNVFLFHFLGAGALALYSFASAVPERLGNIFFKFLGSATLPKFSERTVEEIRANLLHKILLACGAGAIVAVFYVLCAPLFFQIFFPAYLDAVAYSLLFGVGLTFAAAIYLPLSALTALKHTRALYLYNVVNPLIQIIVPLAGILLGGLWGYLIAHILTIIFALVFSTILVYTTER